MTDDPNLYLLYEEHDGLVFHPIPYTTEGGWHCAVYPGHSYSECGLAEAVKIDGYTGFVFHTDHPIGPQFDNMKFADESPQDNW